MPAVPLVAAAQHGAFTTGQAYACGWTSHQLRSAVRRGDLVRLRGGVYAVSPPEGRGHDEAALRQLATAVALNHRRATLTSAAAVALHDVALLAAPTVPCVTYARQFRGSIAGTHLHRAALWQGQIVRRGPALLTGMSRSIADLSREHGVDAGVVSADAALRLRRCTPDELAAAVVDCRGWPYARRASAVVAAADGRSESALESLSRLRMHDCGLPPPEPQVDIFGPTGKFLGRVDFYWDEFGVVGECDGLAKYDVNPFALRDEKRRQGPMEDSGLIFERWGWDDLAAFETVATRCRAAFARGLRPDRAPRQWRAVPRAG